MKICVALVLFFAGIHAHAQVLATVGNAKITTDDFNHKLEDIRIKAINPPPPELFLEDLVRFEVGVQEAEKEKLQNDPAVKERFKQVLYNALLEKQLGKKIEDIKITDKEMREFYKKNPELHLAHILIEYKAGAKPEEKEAAHKRALEILSEVKSSKRGFDELAHLYTDDLPTKDSGGDIGFQSQVTLAPTIYDAAVGMKPGEVRGLIETRYGYHILKLIERRNYDLADKRQIRAALFDDRRAKIFNDYFEKLKKSYPIEINREALKSIKN